MARFGGKMNKLRILILLPVLLFACRPIAGESPAATAVPAGEGADSADSPRLSTEIPPTPTGLPPTWTPQAANQGANVPNFDANVSAPGSTIITAQGTAVPAYDGPSINYVVQRGDTLAEICNEYGVSIDQVAQINHISNWDHIEVGQILVLPVEE